MILATQSAQLQILKSVSGSDHIVYIVDLNAIIEGTKFQRGSTQY